MPEMEPIPDIKDIIAPPEVIDPNINFFLINIFIWEIAN